MFRVKICGITRIEDALCAAEAGADAIGLNFYNASPRFCPADTALSIAESLPKSICKVGVFVNATADEILAIARRVGLDLIQLHGDESPEFARGIRPWPVMRAFRVEGEASAAAEHLAACHRLNAMPRLVLVDAFRTGQYGGTGATVDWETLRLARAKFAGMPLVLAGGLNPTNVTEAIAAVRPWAVDTASGVEESPGKKSPSLVREFVAAAKAALTRAATANR